MIPKMIPQEIALSSVLKKFFIDINYAKFMDKEAHVYIDIDKLINQVGEMLPVLAQEYENYTGLRGHYAVEDIDIVKIHIDGYTIEAERQTEHKTITIDKGFKIKEMK